MSNIFNKKRAVNYRQLFNFQVNPKGFEPLTF